MGDANRSDKSWVTPGQRVFLRENATIVGVSRSFPRSEGRALVGLSARQSLQAEKTTGVGRGGLGDLLDLTSVFGRNGFAH